MRFPASALLMFSVFAKLLAELKLKHMMDGQLDDIHKICIIAAKPDHWISFWMSDDLNVGANRLITFNFQLNATRGGAVIDVWPPGPLKKFQDLNETLHFGDYPRNPREFLYYFTFYKGAVYFTMPTRKGVQTIILSLTDWWIVDPIWMLIVCNDCTSSEEIFLSKLNWGKSNTDRRQLEANARTMSPFYNKTTVIMNAQTKQKLKNFKQEL